MKYIVTGTGRSGTTFMAYVLRSVDIDCLHEAIFNLGDFEAVMIRKMALLGKSDSSWMAFPWLHRYKTFFPKTKVVHAVRNPKDTLDSLLRIQYCGGREKYMQAYRWACQFFPEIDHYESIEDRSAFWYITINSMIEPYADFTHRIEDPATDLLDRLGIDYSGKEVFSDTKCNTWLGVTESDFKLDMIAPALQKRLYEMAKRYGYEI